MKNTFVSNRLTTTTIIGLFITLLFAFANSAFAFKPNKEMAKDSGHPYVGTHTWIVDKAISGDCINGHNCDKTSVEIGNKYFQFSNNAIEQIQYSNACVDDGTPWNGYVDKRCNKSNIHEFDSAEAHCDSEELEECSERISLESKNKLIKSLIDQLKQEDGEKARQFLGRALHTLQDFYTHSNWVNLGNKTLNSKLINGELTNPSSSKAFCQTNPQNPYNEGTFVKGLDKTKDITTGYFPPSSYFLIPYNYKSSGCKNIGGCWHTNIGKCGHGLEETQIPYAQYRPGIAKDTAKIDTNSSIVSDMKKVPFHSEARDLATKATNDYINKVLQAIKNEFGNDPKKLKEAIQSFMGTSIINIIIDDVFSAFDPLKDKLNLLVDTSEDLAQEYYTRLRREVFKTKITSNIDAFKKTINDIVSNFPTTPSLQLPYPTGQTWIVTSGYNADAHLNYSLSTEQDSYGLDFALPGCQSWNKPALAVAAGTVISTDNHKYYGKTILIDHGNGFISRYAHLNSFSVSQSISVQQGQEIGRVGNSGNVSGSACSEHPGVNLHFSMYFNDKAYKPEPMSGYINFNTGSSYLAKAGNTRSRTRDGDTSCSKPIMQGLYNAISAQQTPGPIYLFTDSVAEDAELTNTVIATARAKNQSVYIITTDKCSPEMKSDPVLLKVTKETGGQLFQISQSGEELTGIFDIIKSLASEEYEYLSIIQDELTDNEKNYSIPVDSSVNSLIFSVVMSGAGESHILRPTGEKVIASDNDVTVTELPNGQIINVTEPATGNWTLQATGNSTFSASVIGHTQLKLGVFRFSEVRGRPMHQGLFPIYGEPMMNEKSIADAIVYGNFTTAEFELHSTNGEFLTSLDLTATEIRNFTGEFDLPNDEFRVYLKGTNTTGSEFKRALPALWLGRTVKIEPVASDQEAITGKPFKTSFIITNEGSSNDTFKLLAANDGELNINVIPANITLNSNESITVDMVVDIPNNKIFDEIVSFTLLAESTTNPNSSNQFSFAKVVGIDSDGDSISDRMEESLGTNKDSPDSDGDTITDDIEIGEYLYYPRDSNEDGIIDALDSETSELELNITASEPPKLYFVIDDTGSMRDNIQGIKLALTEYIEILQQSVTEGKLSPLSVLLTFKDQDEIHSRIVTDNLNELLEQVEILEADGGDDCAEDSVIALKQVAEEIGEAGTALIATDAPPHEGHEELTTLIGQLRAKGVTINVILTEAYCVDEVKTRKRKGSEHFEKSVEIYSYIVNEVGNGSSLNIIDRFKDRTDLSIEEWLQIYKGIALNVMLGTIQPTITAAAPNKLPQGGTLDLSITASNSNFNQSSIVQIEGGITVNDKILLSPNKIIANITVPATSNLNRYDIQIDTTLADGKIETAHGIGVIAIEEVPDNPKIISTISLQNNSKIMISGIKTNFKANATSLEFNDDNIAITKLIVHSDILLEAQIYINNGFKFGLHDITVTTGDELVTYQFLVTKSNTIVTTSTPKKYCDDLGDIIEITCQNKVLGDKHIGLKGYVAKGKIAGHVTSEGWVSSVTILKNAKLDGGILTGYVENQGTIANIDYRGGQLTGGNLAGNIIVDKKYTRMNLGVFEDVNLLDGTIIDGGIFTGTITGNGTIKNAIFLDDTILEGITIGEGCILPKTVQIVK